MDIKRSEINSNIRTVFEAAKDAPVFISHYNEVTTVLMSKKLYDDWKAIVDQHKELVQKTD